MKRKSLFIVAIICCVFFVISMSACFRVSSHVIYGFGDAVWWSDDPYFYWHENVTYRNEVYSNNINYKIDRDAPEEEVLTLYGKMEVAGEITLIEFVRGDLSRGLYSFGIYVFRTDVCYLRGRYTYSKVSGESYNYEVYLIVQHAYDTNIENDTDGAISGDEIELPFTNFTIYVTLDS